MRILTILALVGFVCTGCITPKISGRNWSFGKADTVPISTTSQAASPTGQNGAKELPGKETAELCLTMAESLEKDKKDADAIPYYEKARALNPSYGDKVSRRLAVLYDRIDEQAHAMKEFQELLKKYPKDSELLADIGYSYYNRGQWAEAENYSRRAVEANKSNKRGWVNLGLALAQQGKDANAIAAFEKAVTPAEARFNLGFVLSVRGKKEEAAIAYRKALELEPTLQGARLAIAKLENSDNRKPELDNPVKQAAHTSSTSEDDDSESTR